jgi:hypothetical protein
MCSRHVIITVYSEHVYNARRIACLLFNYSRHHQIQTHCTFLHRQHAFNWHVVHMLMSLALLLMCAQCTAATLFVACLYLSCLKVEFSMAAHLYMGLSALLRWHPGAARERLRAKERWPAQAGWPVQQPDIHCARRHS